MSQTASMSVRPSLSPVSLALAVWAGGAAVIAASGVLERALFLIPLTLAGTLVAAIVLHRRSPGFRAAVDRIDLRWLLAAHVVRAPIGAWFLLEDARGLIPSTFAQRAGWGDLIAGVAALALIAGSRRGRAWTGAARLWSLFGALDLLVVVGTANYLMFVAPDPLMQSAITRLPYPLLPTFVVPLMLAIHLAVWRRLRRGADATTSAPPCYSAA